MPPLSDDRTSLAATKANHPTASPRERGPLGRRASSAAYVRAAIAASTHEASAAPASRSASATIPVAMTTVKKITKESLWAMGYGLWAMGYDYPSAVF